jgi:hypothetical protein
VVRLGLRDTAGLGGLRGALDRPGAIARRAGGSGFAADYVARRTAEGKTKTEIMRCLKRYIARGVFPHLLSAP